MQCKARPLEQYFENPSAENVLREVGETFRKGPAAVIRGWLAPARAIKVESKLDMKVHQKEKPDEALYLVREVAIEWRTVELANKQRHHKRTGRVTPR